MIVTRSKSLQMFVYSVKHNHFYNHQKVKKEDNLHGIIVTHYIVDIMMQCFMCVGSQCWTEHVSAAQELGRCPHHLKHPNQGAVLLDKTGENTCMYYIIRLLDQFITKRSEVWLHCLSIINVKNVLSWQYFRIQAGESKVW